ncbi:MraY family glycosyltransferase [Cupriavidus nantongensis]|uniref:Glycosyl transferase n=1 Tax=Cupriavidus nantongensis TaxID=1796606 RepID=A0A142JN64_9BURK|nr:glycosyltransferase [Cupriavidus nantongensis]AMR79526.1 glycosyl transferase [Cupriavidus nantongensis]
MLSLSVGFFVSFIVTLLIVRYAHIHAHLSADHDFKGAQKFHTRAVPRIGGTGIAMALLVGGLVLSFRPNSPTRDYWLLIIAAAPAFVAGLVEDLTKKVSPSQRLIATMLAALLAVWLLDIRVVRIAIGPVDAVLANYIAISIAVTCVAVAGMANAVNIIDGFNGLAAMVTTMMLLSVAYVAFQVNDGFVLTVSFVMIGAILGFFLWNFPGGMVFLGDGGAYLIGFIVAELAIVIVMRHPQVSPWYPVLMVIYPIFETLFSIYRKRFLRGISPGIPDGVHLHMLIYRRLMRWAVGSKNDRHRLRRNSFTSPYLWLLSLLAVGPATLFWDNTPLLVVFCLAFVVTYVWLYWSIVRFRSPRWLIFRKSR